jgi:hypothetical protein
MMEAAAIVRQKKPKYSVKLPAVLHETSGLVFSDNILWTTNDDTDTTIYGVYERFDSKKIAIKKVSNKDWEEITQDSNYFYIGDFKQCIENRKDLHILRIERTRLKEIFKKLIPFHSRIPIRLISRN